MSASTHKKNENQNTQMGLSSIERLRNSNFLKRENLIRNVKFVGNKIIAYPMMHERNKKNCSGSINEEIKKAKKFSGYISKRSQKKIIQIAQNWDDTIQHYNNCLREEGKRSNKQIILLTLTLSKKQRHNDNYIKRHLLSAFLKKIYREKGEFNFIWKAEKQENGNLHFHILLDIYIDKKKVQLYWNRIQQSNGYHSDIYLDEKYSGSPSTKIEALKNKNNSIQYIAKYISKDEKDLPVEGRLWSCNRALSNLLPLIYTVSNSDLNYYLKVNRSANSYMIENDYCLVLDKIRNIKELKKSLSWDHNIINIQSSNIYNLMGSEIHSNLYVEIDNSFNEIEEENITQAPIIIQQAQLFDNEEMIKMIDKQRKYC